ncbi:MAG: hypothetical protein FJZ04_04345 [Candidatus Moranbacteria bacterium]|nr:hypothetical protein [Candidatus Moranbacteria bacterium]
MSKINILIFPAILLVCLTIIWLFAKPLFSETQNLNFVKKPELERLIQQEKSLRERTEKIANEEAGNDQLKIIQAALPAKKEIKSVIAQIEFIAQKDKIALSSISAEDSSGRADLASAAASSNEIGNYRTIKGTIEVKGGYNQLKQLIKNLRKLDRLVNVERISVNNIGSGDDEGSIGRYSLGFRVYWQPEVTPELIKTGLENMEAK